MLIDEIQRDLIAALKNQETKKLEALRYLKSQIKNFEIDKGKTSSDEDIINIIRKQIQLLAEALEQFQNAGRSDLVDKNYFQMQILSSYLPPEISDAELEEEIKKIISEKKELVETNPHSILGIAVGKLKSKASSTRIVTCTKKLLSI